MVWNIVCSEASDSLFALSVSWLMIMEDLGKSKGITLLKILLHFFLTLSVSILYEEHRCTSYGC